MRTPHWIGVVVLALIVGGTVGYLTAPRDSDSRITGVVPEEDTAGPGIDLSLDSGKQVENPPPYKTEAPRTSETQSSYRTARASDSALINAIRALPMPEVPLGPGSISGRIVDSAGNPIAGISVQGYLPSRSARYPRFFDYEGRELHEGLEEDIRNMFQQRALGNLPELRAVSDSAGNWTINGIADGKYRISPRNGSYEFRMPRYEFSAGDEVEIVARRLTELRIKVLLPDGTSTVDYRPAITDVLQNSSSHSFRTGDGSPWFEPVGSEFRPMVPAGVYLISAVGEGMSSGEPQLVEVIEGDSGLVTLQLETVERKGIRGRIVVEGGELLSSEKRIWYAKVPTGLSPEDIAGSLTRQHLGMLNYVREVYHIPLEDPGRYVIALGFGVKLFEWHSVDFDGSETVVDFLLTPPEPEASIVIDISSTQWRTGSIYFKLYFEGPRPHYISLDAWKINENEFRVVPPDDTEIGERQPGWISLETYSGTVDLPVMHAQAQRLKAVFEPQTCLLVDVGGWKAPGAPHSRLSIELQRADGSRVASAAHYSGGHAPAILNRLQPGSYQLVIEYDQMEFVRESIELTGSYVLKRVELPRLYALSILGLDQRTSSAITGGPYNVRKSFGYKDGTASMHLPAGDYVLTWRSPDSREERTQDITITEDTTIDMPK